MSDQYSVLLITLVVAAVLSILVKSMLNYFNKQGFDQSRRLIDVSTLQLTVDIEQSGAVIYKLEFIYFETLKFEFYFDYKKDSFEHLLTVFGLSAQQDIVINDLSLTGEDCIPLLNEIFYYTDLIYINKIIIKVNDDLHISKKNPEVVKFFSDKLNNSFQEGSIVRNFKFMTNKHQEALQIINCIKSDYKFDHDGFKNTRH